MYLKPTKLRDAIALALVMSATSALGTGTAFAQTQTDQQAQADPKPADQKQADDEKTTALDTIIVTGTRIQSQTVTASSPVLEIQQEEFQ